MNEAARLREAVAANPLWYHTIELPHGIITPGWFDLRSIAERLPWPEVRGKRCLDVGTYDGFLAFELERRGAAEVVATDIADHTEWDWPIRLRATASDGLAAVAGEGKGLGFEIAKQALASKVERRVVSVYELTPQEVGEFDVVVCGFLMLHLRDPVRALEAIRGVCTGDFVSVEEIDARLTIRNPRTAAARLDGNSDLCQWWIPNLAGHRRMVVAAGFDLVETVRPLSNSFGPAHPPRDRFPHNAGERLARIVATGGGGVPASALRAVPAL